MADYKVLQDLDVTDEADPMFGSYAPGAIISVPDEEDPSPSILEAIEKGAVELFDKIMGEGEESSAESSEASPKEVEADMGVVPPAPTPAPAAVQHPDNIAIAEKFPAAPAPFDGSHEGYAKMTGMLYAFCMAIEHHEAYIAPGADSRYPAGTRSWHDKNPGNMKFAGQRRAIAEDKDSFAVFASYDDGLASLGDFIERIAAGQNRLYPPQVYDVSIRSDRDMNFYDLFKTYASSPGDEPGAYAEAVAKEMSGVCGETVLPTIPVKTLLS